MIHKKKFVFLLIIILLTLLIPQTALAYQQTQVETCTNIYIVQANDWLSKVADKFLGDVAAFPVIVAATNAKNEEDESFAQIISPDRIDVGWKLCIPEKSEAEAVLAGAPAAILLTNELAPLISLEEYTLDDYVAEHNFSPNVRPEWIYTSPDPVEKFDILPEHQTARDKYGYRANYLWNEHFFDRYFGKVRLFDAQPPQVAVYTAPWETVLPRYRYPSNATLPTGLTTNQFGWRGKPIDLNKPEKTIRIAALGGSTTVGGHSFPYSYPEHLEKWLNLWSEENGYGINFEVINTGREGISSNDIAAVLRYEVLPLDVDYIIYYEGANQFNVRTMVSWPEDVTLGQPPAGVAPNFENIDSDDKTLLDRLAEKSALAGRVRSFVELFSFTGEEPPKPEQTFFLPEGVDELKPDRDYLGDALALSVILDDLDKIKADADENDIKMVLDTFDWFVYDGMILDPQRHRNTYGYLNRVYWPVTYSNMRRMADFQNRVFAMWAGENNVPLIDVAGQMPKQPDLYDDAIHNRPLGTRIRAWTNFENLIPILQRDIESGQLPKPDREQLNEHPYITEDSYRVVPLN